MLASARLTEAGIDHVVLEKNADVGGTWYENTYPGAGVDTTSYLYSYSFFPRAWSTHFGKRDEVQAYLLDFADALDLRRNIRFDTEVAPPPSTRRPSAGGARAQPPTARTSSPRTRSSPRSGVLNRPKIPPLPGLDSFRGPLFHSAQWPEDVDLTGKRVALVGRAPAHADRAGDRRPRRVADRLPALTPVDRAQRRVLLAGGRRGPWLMEHVPYYAAWYRARLSWIYNDKVHPTLQIDPEWPEEPASIGAANHGHRRFYEPTSPSSSTAGRT